MQQIMKRRENVEVDDQKATTRLRDAERTLIYLDVFEKVPSVDFVGQRRPSALIESEDD